MIDRTSAGSGEGGENGENGASIEERLIRRGQRGYERARTGAVWNGLKPDRHPDVIVRATSAHDVREALARARSEGLHVSVCSGGHNWSGAQLRDRAMLIDLSRLGGYSIDPRAARATVEPAVTGRVLVAGLPEHGLAFPVGHCPSVAMGGFLLSGGLGWNSRAWGPACSYVEEIEAVTADGRTVTCSESENADLFWAARGAGPGFFAVATRFRLRLPPHPRSVMTSCFTFPLDETERVAGWAVRTAREMPPSVETSFQLTARGPEAGTTPPGPALTLTATVFASSREEAMSTLEPFDECPFAELALSFELSQPTSFTGLQEDAGSAWPEQQRYAVDTLWSTDTYETQLVRAARMITEAPSEHSYVLLPVEPVSPDPGRRRDMAFSVLGESYAAAFAIWNDPAGDEDNTRWLRRTMDNLDPQGTGSHYIAEADLDAGASRSRRSYTLADWERLRQIRDRWDPDGLFHSYLTP